MYKPILLVYYEGGDIIGHYVYESFPTVQECLYFVFENKIQEYRRYHLMETKNKFCN